LTNNGEIIGGDGGWGIGERSHRGGIGGVGVALNNGDLENTGSISSGDSGGGFKPGNAGVAVSITQRAI
jgi:hypothetical protein